MLTSYRLKYAKNRPRHTPRKPSGLIKHYVGKYRGLKVFRVDGDFVRLKLDIDFVAGGSGARYAYIPANEIWIEQEAAPANATAIVKHEYTEYLAMQSGLSYDKAHDVAAKVELRFRRKLAKHKIRELDLRLLDVL